MTTKIIRSFLVALIGLQFASALIRADGPPTGATTASPHIRVGIYNNKPLGFWDEAGRPQGIFVDILTGIAKQEGWTLEYVFCEWAACLQMLDAHKIDLLGAIAWSEKRTLQYDFTQETVITNWGQVYSPRKQDLSSFLDLDGKRIAVLAGDIHYTNLKELLNGFGVSPVYIEAQTYADVFKLLDEHSVDAGLVNRLYGSQFEAGYTIEKSPIILNPIEVRFAAPKGAHPDLLAIIDAHLKAQKDDGNSIYHRSISRWLEGNGSNRWYLPDWLIWGFSGALLLLALFIGLNLFLRAQVQAKTAELSTRNKKLRHEIAERRQAEEALRRNQATLELALEATTIGLWQWHAETEKFTWDERCRTLFGFGKEHIPTSIDSYLNHVYPDDQSALRVTFEACLAHPGEIGGNDFRVYLPDGKMRWIHSTGKAVAEKDGRVLRIMGGAIDITERKTLEDQLRQSQKMEAVGRLAGGVAHDFNNILTAIIGYSDLILLKMDETDPNFGFISEIKIAGERAAALTRQLLAFSRKQILQPERLDLNKVIINVQKMLKRLIGEDIELQTSLDPGLSAVKADPGQLEQVIMNLAVNARDAMPAGGQLLLETQNVCLDEDYAQRHTDVTPGPWVLLAVSDTGAGIDQETLEHVFEPFFTTKETQKGTGLGLATVHGIIRQSRGHIRVYSEPGRGTTFKIYLPQFAAGPDGPAHPAQLTITGRNYHGAETILLVEDETAVRNLAESILKTYGYTTLTAQNGPEALTIAQTYNAPIDLLLTDVIMPGGMTGRDLAETFAAMRPQAKIIYMSGYTDNAIIKRGILGVNAAFLQKPFTSDELMQKIRATLDTAGPENIRKV